LILLKSNQICLSINNFVSILPKFCPKSNKSAQSFQKILLGKAAVSPASTALLESAKLETAEA